MAIFFLICFYVILYLTCIVLFGVLSHFNVSVVSYCFVCVVHCVIMACFIFNCIITDVGSWGGGGAVCLCACVCVLPHRMVMTLNMFETSKLQTQKHSNL
jgi:hypothetical protein